MITSSTGADCKYKGIFTILRGLNQYDVDFPCDS